MIRYREWSIYAMTTHNLWLSPSSVAKRWRTDDSCRSLEWSICRLNIKPKFADVFRFLVRKGLGKVT